MGMAHNVLEDRAKGVDASASFIARMLAIPPEFQR
jgi:hypothetical protein